MAAVRWILGESEAEPIVGAEPTAVFRGVPAVSCKALPATSRSAIAKEATVSSFGVTNEASLPLSSQLSAVRR